MVVYGGRDADRVLDDAFVMEISFVKAAAVGSGEGGVCTCVCVCVRERESA